MTEEKDLPIFEMKTCKLCQTSKNKALCFLTKGHICRECLSVLSKEKYRKESCYGNRYGKWNEPRGKRKSQIFIEKERKREPR